MVSVVAAVTRTAFRCQLRAETVSDRQAVLAQSEIHEIQPIHRS